MYKINEVETACLKVRTLDIGDPLFKTSAARPIITALQFETLKKNGNSILFFPILAKGKNLSVRNAKFGLSFLST